MEGLAKAGGATLFIMEQTMATHRAWAGRGMYWAGVLIVSGVFYLLAATMTANAASDRIPRVNSCPIVQTSQFWTQAFGDVSLGGVNAPVDSMIEARDPRGNRAG